MRDTALCMIMITISGMAARRVTAVEELAPRRTWAGMEIMRASEMDGTRYAWPAAAIGKFPSREAWTTSWTPWLNGWFRSYRRKRRQLLKHSYKSRSFFFFADSMGSIYHGADHSPICYED